MNKQMKLSGIVVGAILLFESVSLAVAESEPILPKGPHRDVVEETCTACHSAAIILQNRMNRKRWDETITWMQDEQELMDLSTKVRNQILDYLEAVRGMASLAGKPSPQTHRMYKFDYPPNPL